MTAVTRMDGDRAQLIAALDHEGFDVTEWTDEAGATYGEHAHTHHEVRVVLAGSMTIVVDGVEHRLGPHERIDLEAGTLHSARVHESGVRYLAGSRR